MSLANQISPESSSIISSNRNPYSKILDLTGEVCLIDILGFDKARWQTKMPSEQELNFCFDIALVAIDTFLSGKYSEFDALTTTNCCHGTALLFRNLAFLALQLDLVHIKKELINRKGYLKILNSTEIEGAFNWRLPTPIVELSKMFILSHIRVEDSEKGSRTTPKKLLEFSTFSHKFCKKIVFNLQKQLSNLVAQSYNLYLNEITPGALICGINANTWGKYVSNKYIRTDVKGLMYVPSLFAMQISLAYLICTTAKVALVKAIIDSSGNIVNKNITLFQGNGNNQLRPILNNEINRLKSLDQREPVVIFSGFSQLDSKSKSSCFQKNHWKENLPNLILACDTHYPQFPKITDDPNFDSSHITPTENELTELLAKHAEVQGVSFEDSSLFCLTHVNTASLNQILMQKDEKKRKCSPIGSNT